MSSSDVKKRTEELIDVLDLREFADRKGSTYSGGQRRRLEVALGIMHRPEVLFLDEPTTGLDPQNRANLWVQIRKLRDSGTTIFLTTHYLEEADALSDEIARTTVKSWLKGLPGNSNSKSPATVSFLVLKMTAKQLKK